MIFRSTCIENLADENIDFSRCVDHILMYGISSDKAKQSIFKNKIPGFYNYE